MAWLIALCVFTAFLATLILYYSLIKKEDATSKNVSPLQRFNKLSKSLLVSSNTKWCLKDVQNGHRFWQNSHGDDHSQIAVSTIIAASMNEVADVMTVPLTCLDWDQSVENITLMSKSESSSSKLCGDVVSVTLKSNRNSIMGFIRSLFYKNTKLCSRTWVHEKDVKFWLHSAIVDQNDHDPLYTMFMIFPVKDQDDHRCEVTIVYLVDNSSINQYCNLLTKKLAALDEYILRMKNTVVYPEIPDEEKTIVTDIEEEMEEDDSIKEETDYQDTSALTEAFVDIKGVYLRNDVQKYKPFIDKATAKLMEYYHAKNGENGWNLVANIKEVEIFKKPASPKFSAWDCSRGRCIVNVPIHYLIAYCNDLDHNSEYDDMFNTGHLVEHFGELTTVAYLEYKAIWPVSGRDFCSLHATRILPDNIYIMVARSITHPSCPPCKKYVRGKILMGGFVMKVLSEEPPRIELSYITHVDLAGSVPARIVNKVTANQPLSVGIIKTRAEKMYKEAIENPHVDSKYKDNVQIMYEKLERARKLVNTQNNDKEVSSAAGSESQTATTSSNGHLPSTQDGDIQVSEHIKHVASSPQFTIITNEPDNSPFDNISTQYKTLANQASAGLLQQVFEVAEVNITKPISSSSSTSVLDSWEYRGTEKDVMMFRKVHSNEKMHSCIGKGIIPCSPATVWEVIQDPEQRYNYDNMLKETKILEKISDNVMIEYLHFETANCFQKQARDFVVLRNSRIEKDKYLLAVVSINYDKCREKPNIKRGKIISSGWVVEPLLHNGQLYSMVTYLCQINPGGNYPTNLINLVARKQPLCIAYLRKYLESQSS